MEADGARWNNRLVQSIFPSTHSRKILNTAILEKGHERLIWISSTTENHTTMSTYKMILMARNTNVIEDSREKWDKLWKSDLHGMHKLMI